MRRSREIYFHQINNNTSLYCTEFVCFLNAMVLETAGPS